MMTKLLQTRLAAYAFLCCLLVGCDDSPPKHGGGPDTINNPLPQCPASTLGEPVTEPSTPKPAMLIFSKTEGFRHASIETAVQSLQQLGTQQGWQLTHTEDAETFTRDNLSQYRAVIWLNTTGDVLNEAQQQAFESYVESGGGFLGVHAAADTEYQWPWYQNLLGAHFISHPEIQTATVNVEAGDHPASEHLGEVWEHRDEWYNFDRNPRADVDVVLSLDEASYAPGVDAMGDHPIAWATHAGRGRAFYTGLGHTQAAYQDQRFLTHLAGALAWVARVDWQVPEWTGPPPPDKDFTTQIVANGVNEPVAMDIAHNGQIFVIGRRGEFYTLDGDQLVVKSTLAVNSVFEGGLIGIALDPNFMINRWVYLHYTHPTEPLQVVSRFTLTPDNALDLSSESTLLTYPVQLDECCHMAGDMIFDEWGNLMIATGDNTNPFESDGFTPIDERPGRENFDAQRTSANTTSLSGKVLRITPTLEGGYQSPEDNLFVSDSQHRDEIYTMGHRNPYKLTVDAQTGLLYVADIGPDAGGEILARGPGGVDEINNVTGAGNFGWPYFVGHNLAYTDFDFATRLSAAPFEVDQPRNDSPNNTGAVELPNATPAWFSISHRATMISDVVRWRAYQEDEFKLPSYFHGRLLVWNFNDDSLYEVEANSQAPKLRRWLDTSLLNGLIDAKVSPLNGRLYLLAYGGNCCGNPPFAGALAEVRYVGDGMSEAVALPGGLKVGDHIVIAQVDPAHNVEYVGLNTEAELQPGVTHRTAAASFELAAAGGNSVALRAPNGRFVSAGPMGAQPLSASAEQVTIAEQFQLVATASGALGLRSLSNCQFVSGSSESSMVADSATLGASQQWQLGLTGDCSEGFENARHCRPISPAYFNFPHQWRDDLKGVPATLSQTGAFTDVENLAPHEAFLPYDVIVPLWSDGAEKSRWVSVPSSQRVRWQASGKWAWPAGTVFIKHFELPVGDTATGERKRLETRFIIVEEDGGVYGVSYRWREDGRDADLVSTTQEEVITVDSTQHTWQYPSPKDCMTCHNQESTGILGPKTASMNRPWQTQDGEQVNQLMAWNAMSFFTPAINEAMVNTLPKHAALSDSSASLEVRLRSYWDVNCGNCHGPQGIAANWDARFETPLEAQEILWGSVVAEKRDYFADYGLVMPFVVTPGEPLNSILYLRDASANVEDRMPPLGTRLPHQDYLTLLEQWILSLPTSE